VSSVSGSGAAVSVVIPVWDHYVELLPDAVASVRRNSPDVQIIVVDNASSVPLPNLEGCEVVLTQRRVTVGAARSLGIDQVATEFVVVLDADDVMLDGTLDFLLGRIASDSQLTVVATSILEGDTGERHRTPRRFAPRLARGPRLFALANAIWSLLPVQGGAILRTADVMDAGSYPDIEWGDDWVVGVSLAFRGRVEVSKRLGLFYRPTPGSLWRRGRPPSELVASAAQVRKRIREDRAVPGWARMLLPVIAVLQVAAIYLARPAYLAARKLRRRATRTPFESNFFL
jgi:glycosyltransferase involved in cell wall biosynthesis